MYTSLKISRTNFFEIHIMVSCILRTKIGLVDLVRGDKNLIEID